MLIIHFCIKYSTKHSRRTDSDFSLTKCQRDVIVNQKEKKTFPQHISFLTDNMDFRKEISIEWAHAFASKFGVWYEYIYFNKWIHINGLSNVARCLSLRIYKHLFFTWFLLIKRPSKFDVFVKKRIRNFSGYCGL